MMRLPQMQRFGLSTLIFINLHLALASGCGTGGGIIGGAAATSEGASGSDTGSPASTGTGGGEGESLVDSAPLGETGVIEGAVEITGSTVTEGSFWPVTIPTGTTDPSFIITAKIAVNADTAAVSGVVTLDGKGIADAIVTAVLTRAAITISTVTTITASTGTYAVAFSGPQDGDVVYVAAAHEEFTAIAMVEIDILGKVDEHGNPIFGVGASNNISAGTLAGPSSLAFGTFNGTSAASFSQGIKPLALAVDNSIKLVCSADSMNHRVLCWVNGGSKYARVVIGQPNFVSATPQVTAAGLWMPQGVAIDNNYQRLFVTSSPGRVLIYDLSKLASGMNASYAIGQSDLTSSHSTCTEGNATRLSWMPGGIVVDTQFSRLFVADTMNNRVLVYSLGPFSTMTNCPTPSAVLGQTSSNGMSPGNGNAGLNGPTDVAFDPTNRRLYVADSGNQRIVAYDLSSGSVSTGQAAVRVYGLANLTSTNTPWTDGMSECQIANGNRVAASPDGKYLYVSGSRWVDGYGTFGYVKRFPAGTGTSAAPAADLAIGYQDGNCANALPATGPTEAVKSMGRFGGGVAVDPSTGNLHVSDFVQNRITQFKPDAKAAHDGLGQLTKTGAFDPTTVGTNQVSSSSFSDPWTMVIAEDLKKLFVADTGNARVLVYNLKTASDGTLVREDRIVDYVLGQQNGLTPDHTSSTAGGPEQMFDPSALAYKNGYLFVADEAFRRISVFDVNSITSGEAAVYVIGDSSFRTGNTMLFGSYAAPNHIALDTTGRYLFFPGAGFSGNNLRCVDLSEGGITLASRIATYQSSGTISTYTAQDTGLSASGVTRQFAFSRQNGTNTLYLMGPTENSKMTVLNYTFWGNSCNSFSSQTRKLILDIDHSPDFLLPSLNESHLFVSSSYWHGVAVIALDAAQISAGQTLPVANLIGADSLTDHAPGTGVGQLNSPLGIELCPNDRCLYVTDHENNRGVVFKDPLCAGPSPVQSSCD